MTFADAAYPPSFLEHLRSPRGRGDLADATHRGEAVDDVCGDHLALDLRVEDGRVAAARFRVEGCPGAIAVGSALADAVRGAPARPDAVTSEALDAALGGVPAAKRHALRLAIETWRAALRGNVRGAAAGE